MKCKIKFSAPYKKMPHLAMKYGDLLPWPTRLLAVLKVDRSQLSEPFIEWDTKYADRPGHYELPNGKEFLVLLLLTNNRLWTTIQEAWPPEKEAYYRSHVGEQIEIEIID